ncbi:MAG: membrane protein insertion efficiency factor YidD [Proteobacteria bacterium]|nr:membrane protein insertion efficiency factor YidD [Pseudomonadota bacterium]
MKIVALFIVLLGLIAGGTARAAPPDAVRALDFARVLHQAGDLDGAAGEARRFLFFFPDDPRAAQARALLERIRSEQPLSAPARQERTIGLAAGLIRFYQDHLRTFRHPEAQCPSYPNCSAYALQAIAKHGSLMGAFMAVDRLWREVSTAGTPPRVVHDGRLLHYDPLEWNDYWLSAPEERP